LRARFVFTPRLAAVSSPSMSRFRSLAKNWVPRSARIVVGVTMLTCSQERLLRSPMSQLTITRPTSNSLVLSVMTKDVRAPNTRLRAMPAKSSVAMEVRPPEVAMANTMTRVMMEKTMAAHGSATMEPEASPR